MAGKRSPFSTYNTIAEEAGKSVKLEFARRLQSKMQEKGWNQSELARRCVQVMPKAAKGQVQKDFGRDRISHYVRGVVMPRPEGLAVLAKALNCNQSELLPPLAVPTAGGKDAPVFEIQSVGAGRVAMRFNRTITMEVASKIAKLLSDEDAK